MTEMSVGVSSIVQLLVFRRQGEQGKETTEVDLSGQTGRGAELKMKQASEDQQHETIQMGHHHRLVRLS